MVEDPIDSRREILAYWPSKMVQQWCSTPAMARAILYLEVENFESIFALTCRRAMADSITASASSWRRLNKVDVITCESLPLLW